MKSVGIISSQFNLQLSEDINLFMIKVQHVDLIDFFYLKTNIRNRNFCIIFLK